MNNVVQFETAEDKIKMNVKIAELHVQACMLQDKYLDKVKECKLVLDEKTSPVDFVEYRKAAVDMRFYIKQAARWSEIANVWGAKLDKVGGAL